ncbi:MAG: Asp-tRNA(Asn)/Glu-tRNA(Gln) amidotransferase subunit GatC [Patescibacteria group bacterium]|nr:Asp-tRNA(Asn)/Glu-tRNA(Gln) amidotransferase subunit GatC [Patescibacteria group bacterium]MDD5715411.1 Asp-tRNA(Asn)/Glu-tRNA(Gln) amidotransferase subunit GatC [Patescibacteria group bacterium]
MELNERDIEKLASLARIELTDLEKELFADQISSILDYVKEIQEVDTSSVSEVPFHTRSSNVLRHDQMDQIEDTALSTDQFPAQFGKLNKVKPVMGDEKHEE